MKILVIEDDALLLQGLILAMQSEGYVCDGVSTAHEAALSLASNHYSLVVLDLGLPDEDGLHFLARMRREKFSQPVLILTAAIPWMTASAAWIPARMTTWLSRLRWKS